MDNSIMYVGNFPSCWSDDNLMSIFQDHEDVKLLRITRQENGKCFAFLQCVDDSQVVDIVTEMHDVDVRGRNLIVRAQNRELQSHILQSLAENGVLDKHPRNTHHSHISIDKKNTIPTSVADLPVGERSRNQSSSAVHFEKKQDFLEQKRSDILPDANNCNQSKSANESQQPRQRDLPTSRPGISQGFGRSQAPNRPDVRSQASNKPDARPQADNKPDERSQAANKPDLRCQAPNKPDLRCQAPNKPDVRSQNSSEEGTSMQNFLNRRAASNRQPCLQSPSRESKNIGHQSPVSHLAGQQDVKPIQKVWDSTKQSQPNSSAQFITPVYHGTGVPKRNFNSQNQSPRSHLSGQLDTKPYQPNSYHGSQVPRRDDSSRNLPHGSDTGTQSFSNRGASGQHDSNGGELDADNPRAKQNNHEVEEATICQQIIKDLNRSGSYSSCSDNQKDNGCNDDKNDEGTNQKMYFASVTNFPWGTTKRDLYLLFEDLDPDYIIMINNQPLKIWKPTEAIVAFKSFDQVTNAIINFDSTDYYRRELFVTDATDLPSIPELIRLNKSPRSDSNSHFTK